jgi:hypothetical protein
MARKNCPGGKALKKWQTRDVDVSFIALSCSCFLKSTERRETRGFAGSEAAPQSQNHRANSLSKWCVLIFLIVLNVEL